MTKIKKIKKQKMKNLQILYLNLKKMLLNAVEKRTALHVGILLLKFVYNIYI